jgi:hypothetical protein
VGIILKLFKSRKSVSSLLIKEVSDIFDLLFQTAIVASALITIALYLAGLSKSIAITFIATTLVACLPLNIFWHRTGYSPKN